MTPIALRVPTELWARVGWEAAAQGMDRAEWVRCLLYRATKDTRPPVEPDFRQIQAPAAEWREWERVAGRYNLSVEAFVSRVLNNQVRRSDQLAASEGEQ
jgi:hypothetical protein